MTRHRQGSSAVPCGTTGTAFHFEANHSFTASLAAPFSRDSLEIRTYSGKLTALGCYTKKDNSHSQSFFIRYVELSVAEEGRHSIDLNCHSVISV